MTRRKKSAESPEVFCYATRVEALAACVAMGATRVSPIQPEPRPLFTLYRPSKSFPGAWGTCVVFRNTRGLWERASWILDYQTAAGELPRDSALLSDLARCDSGPHCWERADSEPLPDGPWIDAEGRIRSR